jgi:hypothetical protein
MEPDRAPTDRATSSEKHDSTGRLQQMNTGPDNMEGSGEWPSPHTPPRGPAPGTDPVRRELIQRERAQTSSQDVDGPEGFNSVLDADPVEGGSRTLPDDERE